MARAASLQLISQVLLAVASYLIAVILARSLGPASYGIFGTIYSVLLTIELLGRIGLPQATSKLVAERQDARLIESASMTIATGVYGGIFALFWLGAPVLATVFAIPDGAPLFRFAALDIIPYGLFFVATGIMNGRRRYALTAAATIFYAVSKAIGILILVPIGVDIPGAFLVNAAGSVVALLVLLVPLGLRALRPSLTMARPLLRLALPASMRGVGHQLTCATGLWALGILATVDDVERGFFVAALSLARLPCVIVIALTPIVIPTVAFALARGDREAAIASVNANLRFILAVLLPAVIVMMIEARPLLELVYAPAYGQGAALLAVLAVGAGLFVNIELFLTGVLIGASRAPVAAALSLGMLAVTLVSALVLVPFYGGIGAAIATAIGPMVATVFGVRAVRRVIDLQLHDPFYPRLAALGLALALVAWLWRTDGSWLLVELGVLGVVYLVAALALGVVDRDRVTSLLPLRARRLAT